MPKLSAGPAWIARLAAGTLALLGLAGCPGRPAAERQESPRAWVEGLLLRVETRVARAEPDTIEVFAVATNTVPQTWYLQGIGLDVQLHRRADRADPPVWDSRLRRDPVTGRPLAIPPISVAATLSPGDSLAGEGFWRRLTAHEVLGDSLPGGVYHLTAVLRFDMSARRDHPEPPRYRVVLPAGSVRLRP